MVDEVKGSKKEDVSILTHPPVLIFSCTILLCHNTQVMEDLFSSFRSVFRLSIDGNSLPVEKQSEMTAS